MENKSKIVLVHASNGYKHALQEILNDEGIMNQLSDTKYAQGLNFLTLELSEIKEFCRILQTEPSKAFYGYEYVVKAAEQGAVKTLMITDELFRANDVSERKKYISLVETVKESGGKFMCFSSLHTSGEQLAQITGVAATLHFPLPDLEELVEEELEKERMKAMVQLEIN